MATKRKPSTNRIVVTLTKEQMAALDKIKQDTGAPLAYLIRRALDLYLRKVKPT
jgi:hypothetical protein